jgi:hypothetical protein
MNYTRRGGMRRIGYKSQKYIMILSMWPEFFHSITVVAAEGGISVGFTQGKPNAGRSSPIGTQRAKVAKKKAPAETGAFCRSVPAGQVTAG